MLISNDNIFMSLEIVKVLSDCMKCHFEYIFTQDIVIVTLWYDIVLQLLEPSAT